MAIMLLNSLEEEFITLSKNENLWRSNCLIVRSEENDFSSEKLFLEMQVVDGVNILPHCI